MDVDKQFQAVWWESGFFQATTFYSMPNLRNICKYSLGNKGCYKLPWILVFNLTFPPTDWHPCLWFRGYCTKLMHHVVGGDESVSWLSTFPQASFQQPHCYFLSTLRSFQIWYWGNLILFPHRMSVWSKHFYFFKKLFAVHPSEKDIK